VTPDDLRARLSDAPLLLDGGLATQIEAMGHDISGTLWSARALRDEPGAVVAAHRAFLAAGADVIITASYQVSRRGIEAVGGGAREADALLVRSVQAAQEAREAEGSTALVAASVGPYGATNHDGSEYRGRYGVGHRALVAFHRERLEPLVLAGPDLLAVETIPDLDEVAALVEALADHPDLAAWVSMTTPDGRTISAGQPLEDAVAVIDAAPGVVAVGVNCSAPRHVLPALEALGGGPTPLVAYPNAGQLWDAASETWSGPDESGLAGGLGAVWVGAGARLVGGCCGVGPADIAAMRAALPG